MTTAIPIAMRTGMAIPVGMTRPPGGMGIPCSMAYASASTGGQG